MVIKSKVIRFYWSNILLLVISALLTIILLWNNCFKLTPDKPIDLITYNSVISGFLFTALSILISALTNEKLAVLKKYGYINKYFASLIIALCLSILALIANFTYLYFNIDFISKNIITVQKLVVSISFISSIFFVQGIYYIIKALKKL